MKSFFVKEIIEIINGTLIKGSSDFQITTATTHLKSLRKQPNMLFFMRDKSHIDWDILKNSISCIIVTDKIFPEFDSIENSSIILVDNIRTAFWKFVEYYRGLWQIPVVCITGTSGKTTTTEMLQHILKAYYNVHGTKNSANGRTSHLFYLLKIDESIEAAVFETAVGAPGDVNYACKFFKPNIGIITNIGVAHLDGCKTPEAYINAKAEMLTGLKEDGCLIINSDDENTRKIDIDKYKGKKIYFGIDNPSDFQGSDVEYTENGMKFILTFNNLKYEAFVSGCGIHQVYNALATIAAAYELGIEIKASIEQLKTFKNLNLHMQFSNGINQCLIINDTWTLTPLSLSAAFKTLNEISQGKKKVAFIGEIKRLGKYSVEIIDQITDMMMNEPVDILIATGSTAEMISKQLTEKGTKSKVYSFSKPDEALILLKEILDKDTILLTKCCMYDTDFRKFCKNLH